MGLAVLWVPANLGARRFPKGERKALWCARRRISLPRMGLDAPTTARVMGLPPYGFPASFGARRFSKGERKALWCARRRISLLRVGNDAPTTARSGACRSMGSRQLRCPKVSKGRAESPLVRPQAHTLCPGWGMTRRLRRGSRACSPMGRSHFSFVGERKVCKRKPAARRLLRPAPLRVIRKYRRSGHCRARPLYLLRPVSR